MALPLPPREVPVDNDVEKLAPFFHRDVLRLLIRMRKRGFDAVVFEACRSPERAKYLYGFGREYDDGRGVITKAATVWETWHGFGLAVDIISESKRWNASAEFWSALGEECRSLGLRWGNDWDMDGVPVERDADENFSDRPHVQWGPPMRRYPSPLAKQIFEENGLEALWRTVKAA